MTGAGSNKGFKRQDPSPDLTALLTLPALWSGQDDPAIFRILCECLEAVLRVDFCLVEPGPSSSLTTAFLRVKGAAQAAESPAWQEVVRACRLSDRMESFRLVENSPIGAVRIASVNFGSKAHHGTLWVGSRSETFPNDDQADYLRTAATLAETGLEGARLLRERQAVEQMLSESNERYRFLSELDDATRPLLDAEEIMLTAARLLGTYLGVNRCAYADVEEDQDTVNLFGDFNDGVDSIVGRYQLRDFGRDCLRVLRTGVPYVVEDSETDARTLEVREAYRATRIRSMICVSLVKAGRLVAAMAVHQAVPRQWTAGEVELVRQVASRCWESIERTRVRRELHENEARLRQLANTIPQLAWMANPDGWIHWYNERWYDYTGTTFEDMEGWDWTKVHDPAGLPAVLEEWRRCIREGIPFEMTFPLKGADGKFRPFYTRVAPLRDEAGRIVQWFGTNTDVSSLQETDEALRRSEARLREGLAAGRMAIWDWDLVEKKNTYSANFKRIFGVPRTARASDLLHPDDIELFRQAYTAARDGHSTYSVVVRLIRQDNGETRWLSIKGGYQQPPGANPLMSSIAVDVTEQHQAAEELRAADQRKDEFLAMLAHELRNPLAPIRNAAQILELVSGKEAHVRLATDIIGRQVDHLTRLVNDLLDVSRVTRGLIQLDKRPLDIRAVVAEAVEQAKVLMDAKRHQFSIESVAAPVYVLGDHTRLVQILSNVLNNAAKYTPEGGNIALRLGSRDSTVAIQIEDNGIGIRPDLLPHIFSSFTQGQRSPDRSQGGLGLGLALVKSLVTLHDGRVEARSGGEGMGSSFTIELPALAETAVSAEQKAASVSPITANPGDRVMVVDDNVDAASSMALLLESAGHSVAVEYEPRRALERAYAERPPVMLLDIGLPGLDGYEMARRLRAHPGTQKALLIAVTGYGAEEDRLRSKAAGFDHHLVKPVKFEDLMAVLAKGERKADAANWPRPMAEAEGAKGLAPHSG